jgi:putative ABC transport system permease protein
MFAAIRHTLRSLGRSPGLSAAAVATVALGAALTTAMFAIVDGVLLRPLPFAEPSRVVALRDVNVHSSTRDGLAAMNVDDMMRASRTLDRSALWIVESMAITADGLPERVRGLRVSPSIFGTLGVSPAIGRGFGSNALFAQTSDSIVLTHDFWRTRFGGSLNVIGRTIRLDGRPYTIAGVMPPELRYPRGDVSFWQPLVLKYYEREYRAKRMFHVVARVKKNATIAQADAEVRAISGSLAKQHDANRDWRTEAVSAREDVLPDARPIWLLLGASALVLLLACANVANLLLARASALRGEATIRAALGATKFELALQGLREAAVLAAIGIALGVFIAVALVRFVVTFGAAIVPDWSYVAIDFRVLAACAGLLALTTLLAGSAPALAWSREADDAPRARGNIGDLRGGRVRRVLTALQVALAVVLLVGALLLVRSVSAVEEIDPGFQRVNRVAATLYLPDYPYGKDQSREIALFDAFLERIRALPGVRSAGGVSSLPMNRAGVDYETEVYIDGYVSDRPPEVDFRLASPKYFETIGVPFVTGRDFEVRDNAKAAGVAIVNQSFVRTFISGRDPLGVSVRVFCEECDPFRIVGVVGDTRHDGLDRPVKPEIYVPYSQSPHGELTVVARVEGNPSHVTNAMRHELVRLDPNLALASIATVDEIITRSLDARRFNARVLSAFSLCALILAAIGLYGSLTFSIGQRQREIAVRIALGAQRWNVWRLIFSEAWRPVAAGLMAGVLASIAASRALRTMVVGVTTSDPVSYAVVLGAFVVVAMAVATAGFRRAAAADVRGLLSDA